MSEPAPEGTVEAAVLISLERSSNAENARFENSARLLREELRALDVDRVSFGQKAEVPDGAKSDLAEWSQLVVTLTSSGATLPLVIGVVKDWLNRAKGARTVRLTIDGDSIEITPRSDAERNRIVNAYIAKHEASWQENA